MMAVGVRSPETHTFWNGRLSLRWDLYLSQWRTDAVPGGRRHFTQVGLVPMFRYRLDRGASPWFVEGGVGLSYLTASYSNRVKEFGSQWNFSDHLGVGRNFGAERQHELGLYVKHVSNAGLKLPNPGETFVQLRYSYHF
jgi:lipid A 3-O-deacylase